MKAMILILGWKMKGLLFYKLFGSGTGEGFTPVLNPNVYAIMNVWENEEIAESFSKLFETL